jgi:peptidoglycan hydrolase-like protein with peptidoglycan-binding domain
VILFAKYKKAKAIKVLTTPKTSGGTNTVITKPSPSVFPLTIGSQGQEVLNLQKYLNYLQKYKYPSNAKVNENGNFGSDTQRVLHLLLGVDTMSESLYNSAVYSWLLNF